MQTIINILAIVIALLTVLSQQPFLSPDIVELLLLAVAVLNLVLNYLRGKLPPQWSWLSK